MKALDPLRGFPGFKRFAGRFLAGSMHVGPGERFRALCGAGLGILATALLCQWMADSIPAATWLIAPMGASAVLVFAVPASPLAQPWAVVGGNTVSALAGIACSLTIGDPAWAGGCAVALAIGLMFALRCLHPPGGATALLAVLVHAGSFQFAWFPVLVNSVLLVMAGVVFNSLTGRPYPHGQGKPDAGAGASARFSAADLDAALKHYNQILDVSRDDLDLLLHHAELAAYRRTFGDLVCADIMSSPATAVQFGTPLNEAWAVMRQRHIKALPVTDRAQRVVGIVTVADFLRHADLDSHTGIGWRLREFVRRTGATHSDKPEVVGQIMTRHVRVASASKHVIELVPLFSQEGHHHIPIIDAERRLVGMVTQPDLVRALYRAVKLQAI